MGPEGGWALASTPPVRSAARAGGRCAATTIAAWPALRATAACTCGGGGAAAVGRGTAESRGPQGRAALDTVLWAPGVSHSLSHLRALRRDKPAVLAEVHPGKLFPFYICKHCDETSLQFWLRCTLGNT